MVSGHWQTHLTLDGNDFCFFLVVVCWLIVVATIFSFVEKPKCWLVLKHVYRHSKVPISLPPITKYCLYLFVCLFACSFSMCVYVYISLFVCSFSICVYWDIWNNSLICLNRFLMFSFCNNAYNIYLCELIEWWGSCYFNHTYVMWYVTSFCYFWVVLLVGTWVLLVILCYVYTIYLSGNTESPEVKGDRWWVEV